MYQFPLYVIIELFSGSGAIPEGGRGQFFVLCGDRCNGDVYTAYSQIAWFLKIIHVKIIWQAVEVHY
jgi:hypothetical protein